EAAVAFGAGLPVRTPGGAPVKLEAVVAGLFLPVVLARTHARKALTGEDDYDDMLAFVAESLDGPGRGGVGAPLRRRHRRAASAARARSAPCRAPAVRPRGTPRGGNPGASRPEETGPVSHGIRAARPAPGPEHLRPDAHEGRRLCGGRAAARGRNPARLFQTG